MSRLFSDLVVLGAVLLLALICGSEARGGSDRGGSGPTSLLITSNIPLIGSQKGYLTKLTSLHLNTTINLTCSPGEGGLERHTQLQWWDEIIPVESSDTRDLVRTQDCGLTLRLHSLSMLDFGRYRCRCVRERHGFEHGIQFDLERMWRDECEESVVNLLPSYETSAQVSWHTRVYTQAPKRTKSVQLRCSSQRSGGDIVWTKVTGNGTVIISSGRSNTVNVSNPTVNTKLFCHDQSESEVYSIHYVPAINTQESRIVYPPVDLEFIHYQYTQDEILRKRGEINLCLIEPYSPQRTTSRLVYKKANASRTVVARPSSSVVLASWKSGVSAVLKSKVLQGTTTSLLYFINILSITENMAEINTSLAFFQRRLESGQFSCSVGERSGKVSFKLNLTQSDQVYSRSRDSLPPHNNPHGHHCTVPNRSMKPPKRQFNISDEVIFGSHKPRVNLSYIHRSDRPMKRPRQRFNSSEKGTPKPRVNSSDIQGSDSGKPLLTTTGSTHKSIINTTFGTKTNVVEIDQLQIPDWFNRTPIISAISVLIGVVLLAIIFGFTLGVYCLRAKHKKNPRKMSPIKSNVIGGTPSSGRQSFINPLFIVNENLSKQREITVLQKLEEQEMFFPFNLLTLSEELGSGAFGIVKKAQLFDHANNTLSTVAVKMLKEPSTHEDERDLLIELKTLFHVGKHRNLLSLLGASVHQGKLCLIVEFCERGNLLQFLRSKRGDVCDPLSIKAMLLMAFQVANGMAYLTLKKCIHRDLAARNILITSDYTLKIADFGLARKIYHSVYRPSAKRLPIKWMAPEGILDGVCTFKSDVWSFGVLLWEIFTLGRTPYPGIPANRVIRDIESGHRMLQPNGCPDKVYNVMRCCWQMDRTARPDFVELKDCLDSLASDNDLEQEHSSYYNLQDVCICESSCGCCDCSSDSCCSYQGSLVDSRLSHGSSDAANREYINILPRGWFTSAELSGDALGDFFQAHNEHEDTLMHRNEYGSLCTVCQELSDSSMTFSSEASLCTLCKKYENLKS